MKIKGTVLLALFALISVLLYYFVETKYFAKKQEKVDENVVLKIDPNDVLQFEITYSKNLLKSEDNANLNEKLFFKKNTEGKWFILKPKKFLADEDEIEMILEKFNPLTYTKKIGNIGKLEQFGLKTPKIVVTLWGKSFKTPTKVIFGNENPTGGSVYFSLHKDGKKDGLEVYLTGSYVEDTLKKDLNTLRDKTILSFKEEEVKRVEIKFKSDTIDVDSGLISPETATPTTFFFVRKDKENWDLQGNIKKLKKRKMKENMGKIKDIVENIILEINDLKGKEVVDERGDKLASYGLDAPDIKITIFLDKVKRVLLCGLKKEEEGYYVKVDNRKEVFLIDTWRIDNIKREIEKLR